MSKFHHQKISREVLRKSIESVRRELSPEVTKTPEFVKVYVPMLSVLREFSTLVENPQSFLLGFRSAMFYLAHLQNRIPRRKPKLIGKPEEKRKVVSI